MVALYLSILASPVCNSFSNHFTLLAYPLDYRYSALFLPHNDDGVDHHVLLPYRLLAPRARRELDVQSSRRRARRGMIFMCLRHERPRRLQDGASFFLAEGGHSSLGDRELNSQKMTASLAQSNTHELSGASIVLSNTMKEHHHHHHQQPLFIQRERWVY